MSRSSSYTWLPAPGFMAFLAATENKVRWNAFIVPSVSYTAFDGSVVDGDEFLYVMFVKSGPRGTVEVSGLKTPCHRSLVADILAIEGFPLACADWVHHQVSSESDEDLRAPMDRRWSWPHILFSSKYEWVQMRWKETAA